LRIGWSLSQSGLREHESYPGEKRKDLGEEKRRGNQRIEVTTMATAGERAEVISLKGVTSFRSTTGNVAAGKGGKS